MKIDRSLNLERYLLNGPQSANQSRRPVQLRTFNNVPIGARGRKRRVLIFIGITPNPDGRQMKTPPVALQVCQPAPRSPVRQPTNLDGRQATNLDARQTSNELTSTVHQPARRTYARATSTPLVNVNHRPRFLSFPAPDESISNVNPNEVSINVDFSEEFGRLHYDTSDTE